MRLGFGLAVAILLGTCGAGAGGPVSVGLIAASVGETVVLVDPTTGWSESYPSGPVGWLYPAPGGVLFAPDLVGGRTTVLDLITRRVRERLDGITMPVFGEQPDRYLTVAGGEVIVLSYPERSPLVRFDAAISRPWQLRLTADETALLVLERSPEGDDAALVAVDMISRQTVYRRPLAGGVARMALSEGLGLLVVADSRGGRVCGIDPSTGLPVECWSVAGQPTDVAFTREPEQLAVAVAESAEAGRLLLWRLKRKENGLTLKAREVVLGGVPVRLALDPSGTRLAVALASGQVEVVDVQKREVIGTVALGGVPRDLVWCDPLRPGPALPEWSDRRPPSLGISPPGGEVGPR